MNRSLVLVAGLALAGACTHSPREPVVFLNLRDSETSSAGPVGLIDGKPCQIHTATAVSEVPYNRYVSGKGRGRIIAEENHGDYVYYAIKELRSIHFDNATALVEVIERFRSKRP